MEGENMVGWLVDKNKADEFEAQSKANIRSISKSFDNDFVLVRWTNNNREISITFE